jgi:hypothetical protein
MGNKKMHKSQKAGIRLVVVAVGVACCFMVAATTGVAGQGMPLQIVKRPPGAQTTPFEKAALIVAVHIAEIHVVESTDLEGGSRRPPRAWQAYRARIDAVWQVNERRESDPDLRDHQCFISFANIEGLELSFGKNYVLLLNPQRPVRELFTLAGHPLPSYELAMPEAGFVMEGNRVAPLRRGPELSKFAGLSYGDLLRVVTKR